MKINKKGFMLAEVVIVAMVITTVLVFLYVSINRMSLAYDKRDRYYNIDAMEVAMGINDSLDSTYDSVIYYQAVPSSNSFINFYNGSNSIKYEAVAYYAKSNLTSLESLKNSLNDDYLWEYIDYLEDKVELDEYNYLIIVKLKEKDNQDNVYFYALKVGDTDES